VPADRDRDEHRRGQGEQRVEGQGGALGVHRMQDTPVKSLAEEPESAASGLSPRTAFGHAAELSLHLLGWFVFRRLALVPGAVVLSLFLGRRRGPLGDLLGLRGTEGRRVVGVGVGVGLGRRRRCRLRRLGGL
jgi:hypothetical protein